jgi:hypothetical protein
MANGIGITIERTARRKPRFAHIDLRKYGEELRPFFESKGIKLEEEVKYTEKLKKATWQADNGEVVSRTLDDVLNL